MPLTCTLYIEMPHIKYTHVRDGERRVKKKQNKKEKHGQTQMNIDFSPMHAYGLAGERSLVCRNVCNVVSTFFLVCYSHAFLLQKSSISLHMHRLCIQ